MDTPDGELVREALKPLIERATRILAGDGDSDANEHDTRNAIALAVGVLQLANAFDPTLVDALWRYELAQRRGV